MILVIVGTEKYPFNRLVEKVDSLKSQGKIEDDLLIQTGSTAFEPRSCQWQRAFLFDRICEKIRDADLIISHAGAGTTILAVEYGKKLILVPRKKELGEHVDDHQGQLADRIAKLGLAKVIHNIDDLEKYIDHGQMSGIPSFVHERSGELKGHIADLLKDWM